MPVRLCACITFQLWEALAPHRHTHTPQSLLHSAKCCTFAHTPTHTRARRTKIRMKRKPRQKTNVKWSKAKPSTTWKVHYPFYFPLSTDFILLHFRRQICAMARSHSPGLVSFSFWHKVLLIFGIIVWCRCRRHFTSASTHFITFHHLFNLPAGDGLYAMEF